MPAPHQQYGFQEQRYVGQIPLKIVGGNLFGRYNKISVEQTFNMIVSDNFLVPYAGYKNIVELDPNSEGRGIYSSLRGNIILVVLGSQVYTLDEDLTPTFRGNLTTSSGDVFIAENNNFQICITDKVNVYVYNYSTNTFTSSGPGGSFTFPFDDPGYISFQNGRLIIACLNSQNWVLSDFNDAESWPNDAQHVGTIQSKPGSIQAAVPVPGGGNNILIFGSNVAESWQDLGLALFPYQRNSTFNIDYGCLNAASIAELDNFVVWLATNEQSGPTIMIAQGGNVKSISTDGIDFKLAQLTNPNNCTGFLFRQDGHLLYQFTFPDDNLSYAYDFNSQLFFTVTDENLNYHIARQVVFFNGSYYFVSLNGGNVYQFDTKYTDAQYSPINIKEIPRIRICPPLRLPDQRYFVGKSLSFTIENGQPNIETTISYQPGADGIDVTTEGLVNLSTEGGDLITTESDFSTPVVYTTYSEAVDLSISRDGGVSFGSSWRLNMNPTGKRKSRFIYQRLGIVNDATFQLRFNGFGRFVCTDGIVEMYQ